MKKITYSEMYDVFFRHNVENNVKDQFGDKNSLVGVIVFKQNDFFNREYTEEGRSYYVSSDNKIFIANMGGNSVFGDAMDKSEQMVRIDWMLKDGAEIDYCYLVEKEGV